MSPHAPRDQARARRLVVVLGDQLTHDSPALAGLDVSRDVVLMIEASHESRHVPSHAARTVLFLSAMRHFAEELRGRGVRVRYITLDDPGNTGTLAGEVGRAASELRPESIHVVEPGEHRLREEARRWGESAGVGVVVHEDTSFLTSREQFDRWARGRRELTMEHFYRAQRVRLDVLMEEDGKTPVSGRWNYDEDNRESFGAGGPTPPPPGPARFEPDAITQDVMRTVRRVLPGLPGSLESFAWPVTRAQAQEALRDFIRRRLSCFGRYEDAMWLGQPVLYHSALSAAINLKLLHPMECVRAALDAYARGAAPLASVEAFVRQLIGWREFIRGVYDREGPDYASRNYLQQHGALPDFYWTGNTDMACLRECLGQVVRHGYAHHIPRLMVMGNFALIAGVHPRAVSDWFLAMYVDAIDWVTLPNTLGMVMHADGTRDSDGETLRRPVVGTKPYAASGQYISRMSNYCGACAYDPAKRLDDDKGKPACPFTTFYWDFMRRNRATLSRNQRVSKILPTLDRFGEAQVAQITISAKRLRERLGVGRIDAPDATHEASGRVYNPDAGASGAPSAAGQPEGTDTDTLFSRAPSQTRAKRTSQRKGKA